jgi:NitT/TauT family transport system ATP-binding protein
MATKPIASESNVLALGRTTGIPRADRREQHTDERFIAFSGVSKWYGKGGNRLHAVDDVSFDAKRGEFISVLGPSGCGKSTMVMLASGLEKITSGEVKIGGKSVLEPYTDLGIVFQQDLLMDWRRVLGNILVQPEFRSLNVRDYEPRARELLSLVGLEQFADRFPYELSGGMRQRVSICRALIHDPNVLLMDEPFGALDALTRDQLNLDLQRIWQENQKTVLFVTHSIAEAVFLGDRVFVMGPRPTKIVEDIKIDLTRPRHLNIRETPAFLAYVHHIMEIFLKMGIFKS